MRSRDDSSYFDVFRQVGWIDNANAAKFSSSIKTMFDLLALNVKALHAEEHLKNAVNSGIDRRFALLAQASRLIVIRDRLWPRMSVGGHLQYLGHGVSAKSRTPRYDRATFVATDYPAKK